MGRLRVIASKRSGDAGGYGRGQYSSRRNLRVGSALCRTGARWSGAVETAALLGSVVARRWERKS